MVTLVLRSGHKRKAEIINEAPDFIICIIAGQTEERTIPRQMIKRIERGQ